MKKASLVVAVLLIAASAVGQNNKVYVMHDILATHKDVTTMTKTVNAWKITGDGSQVCKLGTLSMSSRGVFVYCIDSGGYVSKFNDSTKKWDRQTSMGTAAVRLIVQDSSNIYSLQPVAHCQNWGGTQYYGVFRWIGSWSEDSPGGCLSQGSIGRDGYIFGIGWDSATSKSAIFSVANTGNWPQISWSSPTDGWVSINMQDKDYGCGIDTNGGMWQFNNGKPSYQLPNLPAGAYRPVGCILASNPTVAIASTTTTGSVYSMPLENWGAWQSVTGVSAVTITGSSRAWIMGQDMTGKPWHWNVNAPTASAIYGGQWNSSLGCPNPNSPCGTGAPGFPIPTHTITGRVHFTSGHGLDGKQKSLTQTYTNDLELLLQDTNPFCDPFFGPLNDNECLAAAEGNGECNQSMQPVGNDSWQVLGVGESIDDSSWINNDAAQSSQVPYILAGVAGVEGVWAADSWNYITNACPLTSPVSPGTCPLQSPEHSGFTQAFEGQGASDVVYGSVLGRLSAGNEGIDSPYVYYDAYLILQLADGTTFNQCLGTPNDDNEPYKFLWSAWVLLPECK